MYYVVRSHGEGGEPQRLFPPGECAAVSCVDRNSLISGEITENTDPSQLLIAEPTVPSELCEYQR